ncbi:hypothetical protein MHU86_25131 [Fragilaria crotonensis]|nr:hypothetical protein MHU86_25131 [Fragilaria crotonensis]
MAGMFATLQTGADQFFACLVCKKAVRKRSIQRHSRQYHHATHFVDDNCSTDATTMMWSTFMTSLVGMQLKVPKFQQEAGNFELYTNWGKAQRRLPSLTQDYQVFALLVINIKVGNKPLVAVIIDSS